MNEEKGGERTRTFSWEDPLVSAKALAHLSGLEMFGAMQRGEIPPPPIMHTLNMGMESYENGKVTFWLDPAEYHYNPIGCVHGGVTATLCDSALGCAVHTTLPAGVGYTTLEIKVNYVRAITHSTGRIYCEAKVIQAGGRVATAEARVVDAEGKLYAHATTTCLIMRPGR